MSTNNEPVGLPAGSYDYDDLKKALGEASRVGADKRHEAVTKAIEATNKSPFDPTREPGYETVEQVSEATGAVENIQVFVGEEPEPETAGKATTSSTKPSEKTDATKE